MNLSIIGEVCIVTVINSNGRNYECRLVGIYDSIETAKQELNKIHPNLPDELDAHLSIACPHDRNMYFCSGDPDDDRIFNLHWNVPVNENCTNNEIILYVEQP